MKKDDKIYLQFECHFSYYYSYHYRHDFIIFLLHLQKRQTTREDNLMPPTPQTTTTTTRQLEKVNSDKYLTNSGCCSKSYGFFFYKEANLNVSTIIPLERSYYNWSKTWIRLFSLSHTTILPSLRFAVDTGHLNSPLPLPSLPKFV